MKRWIGLLSTMLIAVSCESATGLDPSDFDGDWIVRTAANPSCAGTAAGADRHFTVEDAAGGYADGVFNVVEGWDFVRPYRYGWLVTGNFNLSDRTVELNFWHTTLSVGAVFEGELQGDGTAVGTLKDPKPGYSPHTVIGSCVFSATLLRG